MTPAEETVCDTEPSPARGLCIAFCEAMDCDDDPNANQNACDSVKQRWQTKSGKENLPCEISCPCNDIAQCNAISPGAVMLDACQFGLADDVFAVTVLGLAGATRELDLCGFFPGGAGTIILPATDEEADFCYDQLISVAAEQGVACNQSTIVEPIFGQQDKYGISPVLQAFSMPLALTMSRPCPAGALRAALTVLPLRINGHHAV